MNDDAIGMDDDSEYKLLKGKDYLQWFHSETHVYVHAFVLLQDKVNNYLRAKNANRMKANEKVEVGNDESI